MRIVVLPLATADITAALDWFESQGAVDVRLWRGPDGNLRGTGRLS